MKNIRSVGIMKSALLATLLLLIGGCNTQKVAGPPSPPKIDSSSANNASSPRIIGVSSTGVPQIENPATAPTVGVLQTIDGKTTSVESLRGKVIVLDFWETTCGPCRRTIPVLKDLYAKYGTDGLVVLGISDEPAEKVKPFAEFAGMDYLVVGDPVTAQTWATNYQVDGFPTLAIIDRKGKLRMMEPGLDLTPGKGTHERLQEIIPQLLAEKGG